MQAENISFSEKEIKKKIAWKPFFKLIFSSRLSWPFIILAVAAAVGYSEVSLHLPGSTAALFSGDFSANAIISLIINYVAALALTTLTNVLSMYAEYRSLKNMRNVVWKRMMNINSKYYSENDPNYLLSAVTNDTASVMSCFMMALTMIFPIIYYIFGAFSMFAGQSTKLMLSLLALFPLYVLYTVFFGKWQARVNHRIQSRIGNLTGYLTERIKNLALIKMFANEKKEEENGTSAIKKLFKAKMGETYTTSVSLAYINMSDMIATLIAVLWGSYLLKNGEIDVKTWMTFFLLVPSLNVNIRLLTNCWINLKMVHGYAVRLGEIMEAPLEQESNNDKKHFATATLFLTM